MVQKYKVTLILTAEEFVDLIQQRLGPTNHLKVEKVIEKTVAEELDPSAMRGRGQVVRTKRKSKVVDTILSVLQDGEGASAGVLRTALAQRGMSESSLSTGLQILQKSGQIKRDPDSGEYHLAAREAA